MDYISLLAIYGAILSTVGLLWTVGRDVVSARRKLRLTLMRESGVHIGSKLVQFMMNLRVTNASTARPVEVVALAFDQELLWETPDVPGGVRPATTEDKLLPVLLGPAQSVEIPLFLSPATFGRFRTVKRITVEDSTGRRYKVKRSQLTAMQQRLSQMEAESGAGDFAVRIVRKS